MARGQQKRPRDLDTANSDIIQIQAFVNLSSSSTELSNLRAQDVCALSKYVTNSPSSTRHRKRSYNVYKHIIILYDIDILS